MHIRRKNFSIADLHFEMRAPIRSLISDLDEFPFIIEGIECEFKALEGYRTPDRQAYLTTKVPKVTKVGPWQSAHQYGLAVDFAVLTKSDDPLWLWPDNAPWRELKALAGKHGLIIPISWDKGHVEHPVWSTIKKSI